MKAELLLQQRIVTAADAFVEMVVWKVPRPVPPSTHHFKYRLAYVVEEQCVLRYDNERGKGDHRHVGSVEESYVFRDSDQLIADFYTDLQSWNHENGRT